MTTYRNASYESTTQTSSWRQSQSHEQDQSFPQEPLPMCSIPQYSGIEPTYSTSTRPMATPYSARPTAPQPRRNNNSGSIDTEGNGQTGNAATESGPVASLNDMSSEVSSTDNWYSSEDNNQSLMSSEDELMCSLPEQGNEETTQEAQQTDLPASQKKPPLPEAVIPRTGYIAAPRIPAPPKQALKKAKNIKNQTGSSPQQHQAFIQQAVLRVVDAAKTGQREIVWRAANIASDTRQSFDGLADQMIAFATHCVSRVRTAIATAKADITSAVDTELEHIRVQPELTGEQLQQARLTSGADIERRLLQNQEGLATKHTQLLSHFTPHIATAQYNVSMIDVHGQGDLIAIPEGGPDSPPLREHPPIREPAPEFRDSEQMRTDLDADLTAIENGSNKMDALAAAHSKLEIDNRANGFQTSIAESLYSQAENLESFRYDFTNAVLSLSAPAAKGFNEIREQERSDNTFEIQNDRHNLAYNAGAQGERLVDKFDGVIAFLDQDLEPNLTKGLKKAGKDAADGFRHQGKMTQRMIENTSASLALAYPQLIDRVSDLIPEGEFLDFQKLEPKLKAAWQSCRKLPDEQYAAITEQALEALSKSRTAQQKQMKALGKSTEDALTQITDVTTTTKFDFATFGYQVTGQLSSQGAASITAAQGYAERMADKILESEGKADGQLTTLVRSFCHSLNFSIAQSENSYYNSVYQFKQNFKDPTNRQSVFSQVRNYWRPKLQRKASELNADLTHIDTTTCVVVGIFTLGAGAIAYSAYADADDDEVFADFGDLQWPAQPALKEIFDDRYRGTLFDRFRESLSSAQAGRAIGMFDEDASVRAKNRMAQVRNSLTLTGVDSDARRALLQGFHSSERATVSEGDLNALNSAIRGSIYTTFTSNAQLQIDEGYLRGDLGMVLSARMEISLNKARQRGSDQVYQSVQGIEQLARAELARTGSAPFISDEQIQNLTNKAMLDFASHDRNRRDGETYEEGNLEQAQQIFINRATAPIYRHQPAGHHGPHGHHSTPPRQVEINQRVQDYIGLAVRNGWKSEDTQAASRAYELSRVPPGQKPTRNQQTRIARQFMNPNLARLETELRLNPSRADELMPQVLEQRAIQERQMQLVIDRLDPKPTADQVTQAGGATSYMALHTARTFSGDSSFSTSDLLQDNRDGSARQDFGQFGYELVLYGRERLATGARLASHGTGTNEDLMRHTFANRSKDEVAEARTQWTARYGGSMDSFLGINPERNTWGEVSGDLANEIEILARGTPETDQDFYELAAVKARHQREGTGWLSSLTMGNSPEKQRLDRSHNQMASTLLNEAIRQRRLKIENGDASAADIELPSNLSGVFLSNGNINPAIASLVFQPQGQGRSSPQFTGDRSVMQQAQHDTEDSAMLYQMEIDRQEKMWLAGITILAVIATVALMAFGVGFVLAGILVAVGSGLATIAVKSGMRGQRYGWEEAATDVASTAISVAAAGAGGALGGGLGKSGMIVGRLAKFGEMTGPIMREVLVGTVSGAAQAALDDKIYDDGAGSAFGRILLGGLKGGAISGVSAGVSNKLGDSVNRSMVQGFNNPSRISNLGRLGRNLGPTGRNILKESISEGVGSVAGEATGIYIEVLSGQFKGGLSDALSRMGQAGLKDMVSAAGRAGVQTGARPRANELWAEARQRTDLTEADYRALNAASVAAGEPTRTPREIADQLRIDQINQRQLPPELHTAARNMDSGSLSQVVSLLQQGRLGSQARHSDFETGRLNLLSQISEKNPGLDLNSLRQNMEGVSSRMNQGEQTAAKKTDAPIRDYLLRDLPDPIRQALKDIPVSGIENLPTSELPRLAKMLAAGTFSIKDASALVQAARRKNPALNDVAFLQTINSAVQSSRMAQDAVARIHENQKIAVLKQLPSDAVEAFGLLPAEALGSLHKALTTGDLPNSNDTASLFRALKQVDPSITRDQFSHILAKASANATAGIQRSDQKARVRRQKTMDNVPKHLRTELSVLDDADLMALRIHQLEGTLLPADVHRLEQAALKNNPDLDIAAFHTALQKTMQDGKPIRPADADMQNMKAEMLSSVPAEQRHLLNDVAILVLPKKAFAQFTQSKSGQAVTLIIKGKPVVVMSEGAPLRVLREEGLHALQIKSPEWADHVKQLDEHTLSNWHDLPLDMQVALYRNKLTLEIDANQTLVNNLRQELTETTDAKLIARLQLELDIAQRTVSNLTNRMREVSALTPMVRLQMTAGLLPKPQYLDQPARLFNKAHESITNRIKKATKGGDLDENLQRFIDRLPDEQAQKLAALDLNGDDSRKILKYLNIADTASAINNLSTLKQELTTKGVDSETQQIMLKTVMQRAPADIIEQSALLIGLTQRMTDAEFKTFASSKIQVNDLLRISKASDNQDSAIRTIMQLNQVATKLKKSQRTLVVQALSNSKNTALIIQRMADIASRDLTADALNSSCRAITKKGTDAATASEALLRFVESLDTPEKLNAFSDSGLTRDHISAVLNMEGNTEIRVKRLQDLTDLSNRLPLSERAASLDALFSKREFVSLIPHLAKATEGIGDQAAVNKIVIATSELQTNHLRFAENLAVFMVHASAQTKLDTAGALTVMSKTEGLKFVTNFANAINNENFPKGQGLEQKLAARVKDSDFDEFIRQTRKTIEASDSVESSKVYIDIAQASAPNSVATMRRLENYLKQGEVLTGNELHQAGITPATIIRVINGSDESHERATRLSSLHNIMQTLPLSDRSTFLSQVGTSAEFPALLIPLNRALEKLNNPAMALAVTKAIISSTNNHFNFALSLHRGLKKADASQISDLVTSLSSVTTSDARRTHLANFVSKMGTEVDAFRRPNEAEVDAILDKLKLDPNYKDGDETRVRLYVELVYQGKGIGHWADIESGLSLASQNRIKELAIKHKLVPEAFVPDRNADQDTMERMSRGEFRPEDFDVRSIDSDPVLREHWMNALKEAQNWGGKDNHFQKYLKKVRNGETPTGKELSEAFSTIQGYFRRSVDRAGVDLPDGDIHHWNFSKSVYSDMVFDPRNLFPTMNKSQHNSMHLYIGPGNGIDYNGPILPTSELKFDTPFKLPGL